VPGHTARQLGASGEQEVPQADRIVLRHGGANRRPFGQRGAVGTNLGRPVEGAEVGQPGGGAGGYSTASRDFEDIFGDLFSKVKVEEWQLIRHYPSLAALLKHISKTGTAGWHPGQPLLNRHNLAELDNWFIDNYGGCRISYQVFMVNCSK